MPHEFFSKNIARCNQNFLIANLLFTLVLFAIIKLYFSQFFSNMILGPFPMDGLSLQAVSKSNYTYNPDLGEDCYIIGNKYYFRVKGEIVRDYVTASKGKIRNWGEYIAAFYPLIKYGDKYLLVGSPSPKIKETYKGILIPVAPKIAWEIERSSGGKIAQADLFPYMLSATGKYQDRIKFRMSIFTVLLGINLFNYFRVCNRIRDIKNHPLYKHLGRYGSEPEVIATINEEVKQAGGKVPNQGLTTPSWIIRKSLFKLEIERNPVCRI